MEAFLKNKKIIKKILLLVSFFSLIFAFGVLAHRPRAGDPCGQVNWPNSPLGTPINLTLREIHGRLVCTLDGGFSRFVRYVYEWGIFLGGIAAFFALVIAGVRYLTSFGNPTAMKDAKERIWFAILGLAFLLASWLILNTINPELTSLPELTLQLRELPTIVACRDDRDCQHLGENCKCYFAERTIINPDGTQTVERVGSCLCTEPEAPACTKVVLYRDPDFDRPYDRDLIADEKKGGDCENYAPWLFAGWRRGIYPLSSKGFFNIGGKELEDGKCYIFKRTEESLEVVDTTPRINCQEIKSPLPENQFCRCIRCRGTIQFFRKLNCEDMMVQLPPTNRIIALEGTVRSAKLFIETPEFIEKIKKEKK